MENDILFHEHSEVDGTTTYEHKQSGRLVHVEGKVLKTETHVVIYE